MQARPPALPCPGKSACTSAADLPGLRARSARAPPVGRSRGRCRKRRSLRSELPPSLFAQNRRYRERVEDEPRDQDGDRGAADGRAREFAEIGPRDGEVVRWWV